MDTFAAATNLCYVLHIFVHKLNEWLVYPHISYMRGCTKLVKCEYLTQIKLFDLCFKIHSGHFSSSKFTLSSEVKVNELLVYPHITFEELHKTC